MRAGGRLIEQLDLTELSIVLVDDDDNIRWLLRSVLLELGIRDIEEAREGRDGYAKTLQKRPDVLISNWEMKPDGLELVRRVRLDKDSPNHFLPIIMVSAHSELERVLKARDMGVNEFLAKPFTVRGLYLRLHEVIRRPRPFIRTEDYFGPDRRRRNIAFDGPERRQAQPEMKPAKSPPKAAAQKDSAADA